MVTDLKRISGILFYLLGGSFFLAYLVHSNNLSPLGLWWLTIADLPLALAGVVYGGTSLYTSVQPRDKHSKGLMITIGLPLLIIFGSLVVLNFYPLFG